LGKKTADSRATGSKGIWKWKFKSRKERIWRLPGREIWENGKVGWASMKGECVKKGRLEDWEANKTLIKEISINFLSYGETGNEGLTPETVIIDRTKLEEDSVLAQSLVSP